MNALSDIELARFVAAIQDLGREFTVMPMPLQHFGALSRAEEAALWRIYFHEGIAPRQLARVLDVRPSNLSPVLQRLEAAGLIERRASTRDSRQTELRVSAAAQPDLAALTRQRADLVRERVSPLLAEDELGTVAYCIEVLRNGFLAERISMRSA